MAKKIAKSKQKAKSLHVHSAPRIAAARPARKTDWQFWALAVVVVVITLLVFMPTLSLQFVNWDDPDNLLKNDNLRIFSYSWDWEAVKTIFTTPVIGGYNPFSILSFAIEQHFFAPDPVKTPFIFHFDNLWMHLVCTFLVFVIFTKMGMGRIAVFIGALLFGIHPMRVESVAWITERKDVLYGIFFLASLVTYIIYLQSERTKTRWYVLTIVLAVFALFSKVQAVTLPLTMVALDFYFDRKWLSPKILIIEKLPWWLLSFAFGLINVYFLGQQKSLGLDSNVVNYTFIDHLAIGAYAYATYLVKWIYPFKMSPLYPYTPELPVQAYISLAIVPVATIVFLIWAFRKKKKTLLFGWAFFTFNVMFLLQVVGAGQGYLADRFTYIAYIGLFFLFVKGYDQLVQAKPALKMFLQTGTGIYLLLFAYLTVQQIKVWQNGETLWEHVKTYYPDSPLAWKQAGNYYRDEKKDFAKALENYKRAVELQPKNAYVYNSVAKIYVDQSLSLDPQGSDFSMKKQALLQSAIQNYQTAITQDSIDGRPDKKQTGEIMVNLGVAYAILGNAGPAIAELSRGIEINPLNVNGYLNRGLVYFQNNQFELSLKDHDDYIRLDAFNPDIFYERGLCKIALGRPAEAIPDFDKAIALKNTQPLFFLGRAKALRMTGKEDAALNDIRQAKSMGATAPDEFFK